MQQSEPLKIPKFNSTGEFRAWWASVPVQQFCRNYPSKIIQLKEHPAIKPWLTNQTNPPKKPTTDSKIFGKYQMGRKLGEGGMGAVYLAHDSTLNRKVALKIMLLKEAKAIERFMGEARAAAKLKHPNIVQIYEIGTEGKYHYFTMEYIEGAGLDNLIEDKAVTSKRAAEIIRDIPNTIIVEGHTDNVPIHTQEYTSNWELSTARAFSVIRYLIDAEHIAPARLSAFGYGEFRPKSENDAPENIAKNRRIEISLIKSK